jgi:hypothetical protein
MYSSSPARAVGTDELVDMCKSPVTVLGGLREQLLIAAAGRGLGVALGQVAEDSLRPATRWWTVMFGSISQNAVPAHSNTDRVTAGSW